MGSSSWPRRLMVGSGQGLGLGLGKGLMYGLVNSAALEPPPNQGPPQGLGLGKGLMMHHHEQDPASPNSVNQPASSHVSDA